MDDLYIINTKYHSYLKIPSKGSIRGSHASNWGLKVEAATDETTTTFNASGRPCAARFIFVSVLSTRGVTCTQ